MTADRRRELLARLYADRPLAHAVLFKHRHPQNPPPFHRAMVNDWHGPAPGVVDIVFRGGAKSTLAEESIALMAGFREFRNCVVVGENEDRAISRLGAIKRELELNDLYHQAFGDLRGDTWAAERVVLKTGICIQALGKGQSLRGIKEGDQRPDLVFGDDLENRDDVKTPEARQKVHDWWSFDLMPAMDFTSRRWRVAATTLHPESLPEMLARIPGVLVHRYPWYYRDLESGKLVASWPERFPLDEILKVERDYISRGKLQGYRQEFMCQAEAPELKPFKQEMFRVEPQTRTWQAVYSMTDPARTAKKGSDMTGQATWSWLGSKLVIWDAWGEQILPNVIIDRLFETYETWRPTFMGFEEDGLNEWALQPIRQAQVDRGVTLPLKPVKAPVGKIDFIRGLQPFFNAREVIFAKPMPELQAQLLGFPTGLIDVPNALAYALKMRPGAPVYDDFGPRHIGEDLQAWGGAPVWVCLNATLNTLTAMAVQVHDGSLRVLWDCVREGDPALMVTDVVAMAQLEVGRKVKLTAGPIHFDQHNNFGVVQAVRKVPLEIRPGVAPERARNYLRNLLQRERQSMPMVMVATAAPWTLNALAGGYSRVLLKNGTLAEYAEEGAYRTLMEGLESFVGLLELGRSTDGEDNASLNATTRDGRRYQSMMGNRGR